MIESIEIKNCPPYDKWGSELKDCKKINFIYGANGSGKTTISEYLRNYTKNVERFNSCKIKFNNNFTTPIYVYNRQFRKLNFIQEEGIPGVFTLGQDLIQDKQEIEKLKADLNDLIEKDEKTKESRDKKIEEEKEKNENFKENAWEEILKRNEHDFKDAFTGCRSKKIEFIDELKRRFKSPKGQLYNRDKLLERSSILFKSKPIEVDKLNIISKKSLEDIEKIFDDLIWNQIIVGSDDVEISKLIKVLDNSSWVHEGVKYLQEDNSICPFCQKETINVEFKYELSNFFNEEYTKKIEYMDSKKNKLDDLLEHIVMELNKNLEKSEECGIAQVDIENYKALISQIEEQFNITKTKIDYKMKEPQNKIKFPKLLETLNIINNLIISYNNKIEQNNILVNKFDIEHEKLVDDVWYYCIDRHKRLITDYYYDIESIEKALKGMEKKIETNDNKIKELKEKISKISSKKTSIQPTVDQINNALKLYGFTSFHIEPYSEVEGERPNKYRIMRDDGSEATNTLSEGEATFITFLYFMQLTKGNTNKDKVNESKIIVLDDPISSLDSNILYLVSAMIKELIKEIKKDSSNVKQLFILTHNVYFHKEVSFKNGRNEKDKDINYWIIRKNEGISKIQCYDMVNPISSTYELLWRELRDAKKFGEDSNISLVSMQNTMRRIIENYFKITGQKVDEFIITKFKTKEEKIVCKSLLYWINDGSHTIYDDLHINQATDNRRIFLEIFEDIFDKTGHINHYEMMMKNNY